MTRVLVVDDNPSNIYYLTALLSAHGHQIESAANGVEALTVARRTHPELVISDLLMPVMDGYTLLRQWRADAALSAIPFIVYTATYTEPEDERLALDLGADAFIVKPCEPDEFLAHLQRVMDSDGSTRATRALAPTDASNALLEVYSQTLIRKLEEKSTELELANEALRREIAERRLAEGALQASLAEQRLLAEGLEAERARLAEAQAVAHIGSWQTNYADGRVTWSDHLYRIFATTPEHFDGTHESFLTFVHPDDRSAVTEAFNKSWDSTAENSIEHRIVAGDGTEKVVEERWRTRFMSDGTRATATGTCQDITQRKAIETTLRESEERFRQLAENIEEVFWLTNADKSEMLYVSPAFERIWGRACEDLYRSPKMWMEAIHPDDASAVARAATHGQVIGEYDERYRIVRPDGGVRWIRDRAFPVKNEAGEVFRVVGIAEDVTERMRIEAQLLRSQRMESLGTLAGGIAHDLNNALTPILMSIDLLKETDDDPVRREILDRIGVSARQGADMVRQVLSFARGIEGRRMPVSIPALVHDIEKIANDTFLKSIRVTATVPDSLPPVMGDPTQLHQVLLNLCVNARDAMPDGGTLTLSADRLNIDAHFGAIDGDVAAGDYVVLRVQDSGAGMRPEVLERIFEPFFTTKPHGQGTGLGLSTSQAIVKSHGGSMRVQSSVGGGSMFSVFLPAHTSAPMSEEVPPHALLRRGHKELILVVDDEPDVREITRQTLEAFGYRVLMATDGADAVAVFAANRAHIALVLADMMMPVMDGPTMVRVLRSLSPRIPIVAISGLADADEFRKFIGTGVSRLLAKPFTTDVLLATLADVLHEAAV